MKLNNLGTFSDKECRSSCWAAWHMDVAQSPSFPSILFVTCCAWLCLRAVKAINSHLPLFNSVQRNIGAGPSEVCAGQFPGWWSLVLAPWLQVLLLGVCLAQLCPFLLKGFLLLCFARNNLGAVVRVSSCVGKHVLEGGEMLLPYHQIISHRVFIHLLQRT